LIVLKALPPAKPREPKPKTQARETTTEGVKMIWQMLGAARTEARNTNGPQGHKVCQSINGSESSGTDTRKKALTAASSRFQQRCPPPNFAISMHGRG
jgi:hypothetical protein